MSAPDDHKFVEVLVHYNMYDGIPLMSKWVEMKMLTGGVGIRARISWVEQLHVNWDFAETGLKRSGSGPEQVHKKPCILGEIWR